MIGNNRLLIADGIDRVSLIVLDHELKPDTDLRRSSGFDPPPLSTHNTFDVINPSAYIRNIWKLHPISSDKVYLECHSLGKSCLLDLRTGMMISFPLKGLYSNGIIYKSIGLYITHI